MSEKKYPLQTYKIKRTTKTLGVDFNLFAPAEDDDSCSPLEMHNGFSRFVCTIIDKSNPAACVTPRANIPWRDLAGIKLKTEIAMQAYFLGGTREAISDDEQGIAQDGPAFTQKILLGSFKGKTPAEILIGNPQEKSNLLKTRDWLASNMETYPANKAQVQAIDEAVKLLEIGELQGAPAASNAPSSVLSIYKTEYKHMSQKNEQGNTLVYSINIIFDATKNYPFTMEISNCFAPIEVLPSGQHRPVMAKATHLTKSSMAMSDSEWIGLIYHLVDRKRDFELTNFRPLLNRAYSNSYQGNKS